MSRKLLVVGTVVLLAGVAILLYSDPLTQFSLGFGSTTTSRSVSFTRTGFTFTGFTFTGVPGGGGFPFGNTTTPRGTGTFVSTTGTPTYETLAGIGLIGVGFVLQLMTIFLWQEGRSSKPSPAQAPG